MEKNVDTIADELFRQVAKQKEEAKNKENKEADSNDLFRKVSSEEKAKQEEEKTVMNRTLSPLEEMKREKENNPIGLGAVVETKDLEKSTKNQNRQVMSMENSHMDNAMNKMDELDLDIEKRKHLIQIKETVTQEDYINAASEIDSLKWDDSIGNYVIDLRDVNGNPINPEFYRVRTEDDGEYDPETGKGKGSEGAKPIENEPDKEMEPEINKQDEHESLVKVVIDKTGLGCDFAFTEEERAKIEEASILKVEQIETLSIKTSATKKDTGVNFKEAIKKYNYNNSSATPVPFPASGFKASMKPLTYGELADITLDTENINADLYRKRLSVIYDKMTNSTAETFDSFDDFLKKFAYTDIAIAIFGLLVSTFPEVQHIELTCGKCKKTFIHQYETRSLFRLDRASTPMLKSINDITNATPSEYASIRANSAVMKSKDIEMPHSKIVFEIGIISAYQYLYNVLPYLNMDTYKAAFKDDQEGIHQQNILLLTIIRSVKIQNAETGEWISYDSTFDIWDAINSIKPDELGILLNLLSAITSAYTAEFGWVNTVCTYCSEKTTFVPTSIDSLVFQMAAPRMNMETDVSSLLEGWMNF